MWNTTAKPFTLQSAIERAIDKHGHATAVKTENETLSYYELSERSNAVANELYERGYGRNEPIAICLPNSITFIIVRLAIIKLGATFVPINPNAGLDEMTHKFQDADPSVVFATEDKSELILEALNARADEVTLIFKESKSTKELSVSRLVHERNGDASPPIESRSDDIVGHHFTGGTTGKPKGVLFTSQNRTINLYAHIMEFGITETDEILLTTPLVHAARLFLKAGLLVGATIHVDKSFDAARWLEWVDDREITLTFMVPTMIYRVLDHQDLKSTAVGSLRSIIYGAAPMSTSRIKEAIEEIGPVFTQLYGQTEVPDLVTTLSKQAHQHAYETGNDKILQSAGKPCLMADIQIVDVETGRPLPQGEEGEILASAPYMMKEYHNLPETTEETISEGWVHTGDIGRIDENSYLYILDRISNMIITGGMNVFSVEVEDVINTHPEVRNCCVIGIPDDEWGERVTAVIVSDSDNLTADDIRQYAEQHLADYKKPKQVNFVKSLPETELGKIDKVKLREELEQAD